MTGLLLRRIAQTVRELRLEKQLSQEELAHRSGLDRTYISGVERGVRNLTVNSLESIITSLGVSTTHFFKRVTKAELDDLSDK